MKVGDVLKEAPKMDNITQDAAQPKCSKIKALLIIKGGYPNDHTLALLNERLIYNDIVAIHIGKECEIEIFPLEGGNV
jgi:hypothetical protein